MKVAVDIGNTHTVLGEIKDQTIKNRTRLETRSGMTTDEILDLWTRMIGLNFDAQTELLVASVVPELTNQIRRLRSKVNLTLAILEPPWSDVKIDITTQNPSQVGPDRVAGATALYHEFGQGIVVDFGTATTLDVVTSNGEYRGGVIFPGIEASASGLSGQAAMLPQVSPEVPESFSFDDTRSGLQSGLFYGSAGAVERLVNEMIEEIDLHEDLPIVATGGGAEQMESLTDMITHVRKNLVLEGLRQIYDNEGNN